ncbi:MAG: VCBS repeat-containing protein [Spongiibacteraceae bacterium]
MRCSLRLSLIAFSFSLICACGGGGGGSGNGGSNTSNTGNNLPAASATITRANAKQLTQAALTPAILSDTAIDEIGYYFDYFHYIGGVQSNNSLIINENSPCPNGGSYQFSGTISATDDTGDVTLTYTNCVVNYSSTESATYNGSIQMKLSAVNVSGYPTQFEYIYRNYRTDYSYPSGYISSGIIDGAINMVSANKITTSLILKDLQSGESISTKNFESIYVLNTYPLYAQRNGYVTHSKWGTVRISPDLTDSNASVISGGNQATIRAIESPYAYSYFDLSLDENGDSNYDSFSSGFMESFDVTYSNNTAPTVNVDYSMLHPGINDAVNIPLNGISDNENDFLSYSALIQNPNNVNINLTLTENKTLSFHTHGAGDYVIALTVNDGNGGITTQNISIHVSLPEPQVSPVYNSSIDTGDTVAINLQPTNSDAGPFTYRVISGPTGLTVDNDGIVHWQAGVNTFFPKTDIQAVVQVSNADHIISVPLQLTVLDPNKTEPLARTNIGGPSLRKNTFVLDLDNDGKKEILTTDNDSLIYTMQQVNGTYAQDWVYPYAIGTSQISFIYPFNLNGNGDHEIAVQTRDTISVIDKAHRKTDRSTRVSINTSPYDMTFAYGLSVADLEGDGSQEIITLIGNGHSSAQVVILDGASLVEKWRTSLLPMSNDFSIGNVDNDSALEIVTSNGYVFDGLTQASQWIAPTKFGNTVSTGDIDGNGTDEIVGATSDTIQAFSAVTESSIWQATFSGSIFTSLALAQLDIDPEKEILAVDATVDAVLAYDTTNTGAALKWSTAFTHGYSSPEALAGDLTNDNSAEIVLLGSDRIAILNSATHAVDFSNQNALYFGFPKSFVGGSVGTFGGANLAIFNTTIAGYTGMSQKIVSVELEQGTIQQGPGIYSSSTANFCVADYDSDGTSDVIATASSDTNYNEYAIAFDFLSATKKWARTTSNYTYGASNLITCGDFNNDGHIDTAGMFDYNHLEIDDLFHQTFVWIDSSATAVVQLANADLDGDGKTELITLDQNSVKAWRFNGTSYSEYSSYNLPATIGNYYPEIVLSAQDIDGDGRAEIIIGAQGLESTVLVVLNSDLTERTRVNVDGLIVAISPEPTNDGQLIVAIHSTEPDTTAYYSVDRTRVAGIDLVTGNWVWRSPMLLSQVNVNSLHAHNTGTANPRLVIGTQAAAIITR